MTEDITIHLADNGIMMTGEEFIALAEESYGGNVIKKLKQAYDNRQNLS